MTLKINIPKTPKKFVNTFLTLRSDIVVLTEDAHVLIMVLRGSSSYDIMTFRAFVVLRVFVADIVYG